MSFQDVFHIQTLYVPGQKRWGTVYVFNLIVYIRKILILARVYRNLFATAQSSLPAQQGYVQPTEVKCEE